MNKNEKQTEFNTIIANSIVNNVTQAVEFYTKVFGAEETFRLNMANGKVVHCELKFDDSRINLSESMDGWPEQALLAQIYVTDSDATFNLAIKEGAKELSPVVDMFFGSREGRVIDPFGNTWTISTRNENLSNEEIQRRFTASNTL